MALVIIHPDYVNFNNKKTSEEYPINYYSDFLKYVKDNYQGRYWNALPKEVAAHYKKTTTIN